MCAAGLARLSPLPVAAPAARAPAASLGPPLRPSRPLHVGRRGPSPPVHSRPVPDPLGPHGAGVPYLVLLSPLLVRFNWPLMATPSPDLAATAPSYASSSRGHGVSLRGFPLRGGRGRDGLRAPPARPQPKSTHALPTQRGTGTPGIAGLRAGAERERALAAGKGVAATEAE